MSADEAAVLEDAEEEEEAEEEDVPYAFGMNVALGSIFKRSLPPSD